MTTCHELPNFLSMDSLIIFAALYGRRQEKRKTEALAISTTHERNLKRHPQYFTQDWEQNIHTSLLVAYFSQAVTHSSMVSTLISSGMSVCWGQTQSYDMNINKSARNNTALPSSFLTVPSAVCHCDAWFSQRALTDQMCEDTIATDLILQLVLRSCLLILENTTPCVSHTWACCVA